MLQQGLISVLSAAAVALTLQQEPATDRDWREITRLDVEATYRLLLDNHPGALPVVGDEAFRQRLTEGRALAIQRAATVTDAGGHRAVLNAFAGGMGDAHIAFQPTTPVEWNWTGLVFRRQAGAWRVAVHQPVADEADLTGARLLTCDGADANDVARAWLDPFKIDWTVEAQRDQKDVLLLLDDDNPFLQRPSQCRFEVGDQVVDRPMTWRPIPAQALRDAVARARPPQGAGMGVRTFAGGHWIALQTLGEGAETVVRDVEAQVAMLRRSPVVVLDLRGNGGGYSLLGRQIANALMGDRHVRSRLSSSGACAASWRVTPDNLAEMRRQRDVMAGRGLETDGFDDGIAGAERALAAGRLLDPPPRTCPEPPRRRIEPSRFEGRLVLITDEYCFSSCLMVADDFRRLGALHVGHTTNRDTRYMEVRRIDLPSGLGRMSTMQKVAWGDSAVGPFVPEIPYQGDMNDDPALEAWVAALPRSPRGLD